MYRLIVYRKILTDERIQLLSRLTDCPDSLTFKANYYTLCSATVNNLSMSLADQILDLMLSDENVFTLCAEKDEPVSSNLRKAVLHDISVFKDICTMDFSVMSQKAGDTGNILKQNSTGTLVDLFISNSPEFIFDFLYTHYRRNGCGIFHNNYAFNIGETLEIEFVKAFNPLTLDALYGYEDQKKDIISNTERLINGLPAHHVLLFGDSGTGKSTVVKAMLPLFGDRKLRLIEVDKDKLHTLPALLTSLSERGLYFIVFIDDLSFEHDDGEYKFLKSVIQGSLYEIASNVRFYITSNRRNIVKQNMQARENEVNVNDYLNETVSMTDRFGLKVYFDKPTKSEYINMVRFIADYSNIPFDDETGKDALKFAFFNGGFNGRSARQFIDSITVT